jgi:hypothetical protein
MPLREYELLLWGAHVELPVVEYRVGSGSCLSNEIQVTVELIHPEVFDIGREWVEVHAHAGNDEGQKLSIIQPSCEGRILHTETRH